MFDNVMYRCFVEVDIDWYLNTLEKYSKKIVFAMYLNTLNKYFYNTADEPFTL